MTRNVLTLSGLCAALLLAGCGSDSSILGGSSTPPITVTPAEGAEGVWRGNINTPVANARLMEAMILGDGDFWMVYSNSNDPTQTDALLAATGIVSGTATPNDNGTYTVTSARHISLEDSRRNSVGVSGTFSTGSTLTGTITQSPAVPGSSLPSPADFTALYRTAYNNNLTLAHLAGTYNGSMTTNAGKNSSSITIDGAGAITGSDNTGCTFTGTATTRERGNVFDVTLAVGNHTGCGAAANKSMAGVISLETNRAGLLALDGEQKQAFIFSGVK
ncbi:MAG: uncharacterized protein K0S16_744 [Moraxellaceae bacterium]|nr:uncharacterized protein [Moraxellaceae bacterium]